MVIEDSGSTGRMMRFSGATKMGVQQLEVAIEERMRSMYDVMQAQNHCTDGIAWENDSTVSSLVVLS